MQTRLVRKLLMTPADGPNASRLYWWLINAGSIAAPLLAVSLMLLPHDWVVGGKASNFVDGVVTLWPKMAADYANIVKAQGFMILGSSSIEAANTEAANKYVIGNVLIPAMLMVEIAAIYVLLLVSLLKTRQPIGSKYASIKLDVLFAFLTVGTFWICAIAPAPFSDNPARVFVYPKTSLAIVVASLFWAVFSGFFGIAIVRRSKRLISGAEPVRAT